MNKINTICFSLVFCGFLISCKTSFKTTQKNTFKESKTLKKVYYGFELYDLAEKKSVFNKNEKLYFQPASNMKLLTFYAGLKTLGDSVQALKYIIRADSLIFWGTGDPSFLHPDLKNTKAFDFLKSRKEKLFYSDSNNDQPIWGAGWQWDDYNEDYQPEINGLPLFGNIVRFTNLKNELKASPAKAADCINFMSKGKEQIIREIDKNCFSLPESKYIKPNFEQDVPFKVSTELITELLTDTLKKPVSKLNWPLPKSYNSIYSGSPDSLFRRMLHVSDNMLAEQIVLMASKSDTLNTETSIKNILTTFLSDLPDKPRWVDGSGLSRYNLITPQDLVKVLEKTYNLIPEKRLFSLLSEGGKTGNLKNMFKNQPSFVFAKSGSFSNNYNLSGFLIGASGKRYAFSFMNNNFMNPMADIRKEVERILIGMREKL
jgi:serine-type D-Ala-D-Ala carboxypeptidase/endopeptidase (penicillin-binding protein 4)